MDQLIIPFGKYNGQPVEVLQADPKYCQWLCTQDWFRERYSQINTLIINNFTKPEDTPEHNALQALFLNDKIVHRLIVLIEKPDSQLLRRFYEEQYKNCIINLAKQKKYVSEIGCDDKWLLVPCIRDGRSQQNYYYFDDSVRLQNSWNNPETSVTCGCCRYATETDPENMPGEPYYTGVEFEVHGWDVCITGGVIGACTGVCCSSSFDYFIEVKPCLGDDYPSILRQMKANDKKTYDRKCILVYKDFTATGATLEQVKAIFHNSGYIVLSFEELEAEE